VVAGGFTCRPLAVEGQLFQVPCVLGQGPLPSNHNRVLSNRITFAGHRTGDGEEGGGFALLYNSNFTIFDGNVVTGAPGALDGLAGEGHPPTELDPVAGSCALLPDRTCALDSDCNIPGFDATSWGDCLGISWIKIDGRCSDPVVTNNVFQGT